MAENQQTGHSSRTTPLWVISLFISLTEAMAGIAATQTAGGVQVALTCFVIAFPLLVAAVFFAFLWKRPGNLYSPGEYGDTPVKDFVDALHQAKENAAGTPTPVARLEAVASEATRNDGPAADHYLQELNKALDLLEDRAEAWPDLVTQEAWQLVVAALDMVAQRRGLPSSKGMYVLHAEIKRVFGEGLPPTWVAKVFYGQFPRLWKAVTRAASVSVKPTQAVEFAREAINIAWLIPNLERYKDWSKTGGPKST